MYAPYVHCSFIYNCQGTDLSLYWQMTGWKICGTYMQWNIGRKNEWNLTIGDNINLEDIMLNETSQT